MTNAAGDALNKAPVSPNTTAQPINSTTPVVATVVPASAGNPPFSGPSLSYCQVIFQLKPAMTIEVGLPLNTADDGAGGTAGAGLVAAGAGGFYGSTGAVNNTCIKGNWNGKIETVGNGGFSARFPQ